MNFNKKIKFNLITTAICREVVGKPTSEVYAMTNNSFRNEVMTTEEFVKVVCVDGHSFLPSRLKGRERKESNADVASLLVIDIDNAIGKEKVPEDKYISWESLQEDRFLCDYAFMMYETESSTKEWNRMRVLFLLQWDTLLEDYRSAAKRLIQIYRGDRVQVSPTARFAGAVGKRVHIFDEVLDTATYKRLANEWRAIEAEEELARERERKAKQKAIGERWSGDLGIPSVEEMRNEILPYVPVKQSYMDWSKVVSALANHYPEDAEWLVEEWSKGRKGEVRAKIRNPMRSIGIGTIINIAKQHGYVPRRKTRSIFEAEKMQQKSEKKAEFEGENGAKLGNELKNEAGVKGGEGDVRSVGGVGGVGDVGGMEKAPLRHLVEKGSVEGERVFRFKVGEELDNTPVAWILDDFFARQQVTWIWGKPSQGKSLFVQLGFLMQNEIGGLRWRIEENGGAFFNLLYIANKDSSERVLAERERYVKKRTNVYYLSEDSRLDAMDMKSVERFIETMKRSTPKMDAIVFDTASMFMSTSGIDTQETDLAMRNFRTIAESLNVAVILIGHSNKNGVSLQGNAKMLGGADIGWRIQAGKNDMYMLVREKDRISVNRNVQSIKVKYTRENGFIYSEDLFETKDGKELQVDYLGYLKMMPKKFGIREYAAWVGMPYPVAQKKLLEFERMRLIMKHITMNEYIKLEETEQFHKPPNKPPNKSPSKDFNEFKNQSETETENEGINIDNEMDISPF